MTVYLFGSRRFGTGSVRSDIDLIVDMPRRITREEAQQIWDTEPYLDIFADVNGAIESIVNESKIAQPDQAALLEALSAVPLIVDGIWQSEGDEYRVQTVLAERNPGATIVDLHELGTRPRSSRADILVITALPEEFRAAIATLGATRAADTATVEVVDYHHSPWRIAISLMSQMGSVNAALVTSDELRRTKAGHVVLLRLAAGVRGVVELEDVVIPAQVVYYEGQKLKRRTTQVSPSWIATDGGVRRQASVFPQLRYSIGARQRACPYGPRNGLRREGRAEARIHQTAQ